jgi:hypothetical protein
VTTTDDNANAAAAAAAAAATTTTTTNVMQSEQSHLVPTSRLLIQRKSLNYNFLYLRKEERTCLLCQQTDKLYVI